MCSLLLDANTTLQLSTSDVREFQNSCSLTHGGSPLVEFTFDTFTNEVSFLQIQYGRRQTTQLIRIRGFQDNRLTDTGSLQPELWTSLIGWAGSDRKLGVKNQSHKQRKSTSFQVQNNEGVKRPMPGSQSPGMIA